MGVSVICGAVKLFGDAVDVGVAVYGKRGGCYDPRSIPAGG